MVDAHDDREYTNGVGDQDLLSVFEDGNDPVYSAQEVADAVGLDRSTVYRRLRGLADRGFLRNKKVGARAVVWWYSGHTEET